MRLRPLACPGVLAGLVWTVSLFVPFAGAQPAPPVSQPVADANGPVAVPADAAPPVQLLPVNPPADGPSPRSDSLAADAAFANLFTGGPFGSPILGKMSDLASYRLFWVPDQPVRGQPTDLGLVRQDLNFVAPCWQDATDEFSVSGRFRSEVLEQDAVFPVSGFRVPEDLWEIGLGGSYRHRFDNDWIAGGSVQVGSASDRPFGGWDEMTIGLSTFLRVPRGETDAWLFMLSYSPTAQLPFPIPGVAYIWVPSDQLRMNVGLPFQVIYRPEDDLTLSFSYMLLTSIHARATYHCWGPLRVYAGYDWENEAYLPADRPESKDRLFIYDMRLSGGVQAVLGGGWVVDLSTGYVFDRFLAFGSGSALSTRDRIDIGGGPFLALSGIVRW